MAKKKKPAGNPARGFATTSIPSKPRADTLAVDAAGEQIASALPKPNTTAPARAPATHIASPVPAPSPEPAPTPEELEAQLERDDLQLLVEKHAPKVRREASRHAAKLQADRRVLRTQSHAITVYDWLSRDIVDGIVSLAQAESNDSNRRHCSQSLLRTLTEEDAVARLWILDLTLRDLGFSDEHIQPTLVWLCANAASVDASTGVWGLQECLEWLALDHCEGHSFSYDEPPKRSVADASAISSQYQMLAQTDTGRDVLGDQPNHGTEEVPSTDKFTPDVQTPADSDFSDIQVSDLDSDLELDDLIPAYLKIKAKLYEIDPQLVEAASRKPNQGLKPKKAASISPPTPAVRKLLAQLQQLRSDVLFDEDEAEVHWPARRNEIARSKARKRLHAEPPSEIPAAENTTTTSVAPIKHGLPNAVLDESAVNDDSDDDSLLGDIFSTISETPLTQLNPSTSNNSSDVTLRDFGKASGLNPRKVLEESIRSRDPNGRLTYKMISPTTYICRHSLTITWSKDFEGEYDTDIVGITCYVHGRTVRFEATSIAAITVNQSEEYISTAALFSISAALTKEEKTYLRLPSNWREVYREFLSHRRARLDALDRSSIKHYRSIIQEQIDIEESDGVVLTNRFKLRNQAATASSASNSGYNTPIRQLDSLEELWQQKVATASYQYMLIGRMNLPVFDHRSSILSTIDKSQVTILCGETGCGKSTQIPSFILEHELSQGKACKIYCTEPRRISAISLAQRVSEELGEASHDLGTVRSLVGYAIRLESKTSSQTRLVYATVGVVLRMLESAGDLRDVTHLIIDEVHERSIDTDFLLVILRSLIERRPELRVVLMSATVDAARFSRYLNDAPILNIPGRTFPVQTRYLEDAIELTNYVASSGTSISGYEDDDDDINSDKSGIPNKLPGYSPGTREVLSTYDEYAIDFDLILRLIETTASDPQLSHFCNAVLVFLPGIAEIRQLNEMLVGHPSFDRNWYIYPLHSTISSEDQQAAFIIPPPGIRKIVLATNIAETGVTIPDITCVIDTGKHKEMRYDERRQLSRLTQSFISRANAKQRRGRAGRVQEGLCYHLFTKHRHDTLMAEQQTPEMLRLSLQDLVMRTKICKLGDIEATLTQALDPPSSKNIRRAIDALIGVDALTPSEDLTPLGRQIARLPLDAHLGKLVILSSTFSCVDVAITIAAILSSKSPFLTPFGARQRAAVAHLSFKKGDSDLLTTYNAYRAWKKVCMSSGRSETQFCHKNFLSTQNLGNIEDLKAQLLSSLVDAGFLQLSPEERRVLSRYRSTTRNRMFVEVPAQFDINSENEILVNSVITAAFYPKILIRDGKGWRNISNNQTVSLSPTSVNKGSTTAAFLSYYHIMQSSNKFYNAHSTSIAHPLPMVLIAAADVEFKLHAGVMSLPGNVLRFAVRDGRDAVALKVLRRRIKEILANCWKTPGRQFSERDKEWLGLFNRIFQEKFDKEEKCRERTHGKAR